MAGFRTHITVSTLCGVGYGVAAVRPLGFGPEDGFLAASITAVGGMLPDLDSDSGVPVRELSGLAATVIPLLLLPRLLPLMSQEGVLAALVMLYLLVRYGARYVFKRITVHRGMFHSLPAMLIFGLLVYLEYRSDDRGVRLMLAGGVMVGFLSHLILDEIYSVDFNGVRLRLNQFAGSALKLVSPSWVGTAVCYGILGGLLFLAYLDWVQTGGPVPGK